MEKLLVRLAQQLDAIDEASLMSLWSKYATTASRFEPTKRWEEATLIFSLIQAKRWKNQLFNYHWSKQSQPLGKEPERVVNPMAEYPGRDEERAAMRAGQVDALLESVLSLQSDEKILAKCKLAPFYYITLPQNTQLMQELEQAMYPLSQAGGTSGTGWARVIWPRRDEAHRSKPQTGKKGPPPRGRPFDLRQKFRRAGLKEACLFDQIGQRYKTCPWQQQAATGQKNFCQYAAPPETWRPGLSRATSTSCCTWRLCRQCVPPACPPARPHLPRSPCQDRGPAGSQGIHGLA
jgi:hypothetical protein